MDLLWVFVKLSKGYFPGGLEKHTHSYTYEWPFHIKFMKRAFGEFHEFHMKWPPV